MWNTRPLLWVKGLFTRVTDFLLATAPLQIVLVALVSVDSASVTFFALRSAPLRLYSSATFLPPEVADANAVSFAL